MLYLSGVQGPAVREAVAEHRLGVLNTPANAYRVAGPYACDNGRFGKGWPGESKWWRWLARTVDRDLPWLCRFAVAPDVPFDAEGTLRESTPWLARIRALGVPAAFAAQNGAERPGMVPWDDVDVLFLGGDTAWKLGPAAADLALDARARGKRVHMARVNSHRRLDHAHSIGADTADGTFLAWAPDVNVPRMLAWLDKLDRRQNRGVQYTLPGMP